MSQSCIYIELLARVPGFDQFGVPGEGVGAETAVDQCQVRREGLLLQIYEVLLHLMRQGDIMYQKFGQCLM